MLPKFVFKIWQSFIAANPLKMQPLQAGKFCLELILNFLKSITIINLNFKGFLMGLGDQLAQNFAENRPITRLDFGRTACFFGIGLFFVVSNIFQFYFPNFRLSEKSDSLQGPATKIWYRKLHRMFGSGGTYIALKKVAFDQIFFAPLFIAALVVIIGRTQRENWTEIKHKLQNDYPDIVKSNYKVSRSIFRLFCSL